MHELLAKVPLFADLDEQELARAAEVVEVQEHPAGTPLFACGEPSTCFYVIDQGRVAIRIPASAVQEERVVELGPGAFFGEMGMLRGKPRMADATVKEPARLLVVHQGDFDELMSVDAALSGKVTQALRARLAQARPTEEAEAAALEDPHSFLFLGAGPEVGTSFLAANFACKLRDLGEEPREVLVLDFRIGGPGIRAELGCDSPSLWLDELLKGGASLAAVKAAAVEVEPGIHLLTVSDWAKPGDVDPEAASDLVSRALEGYTYLVVDAPPGSDALSLALARVCHLSHLVLTPAPASVAQARDALLALKGEGLDGRVRLVATRTQAGTDLESLGFDLGEEILAGVPDAGAEAEKAREAGTTLVRHDPRAPASVQVTRVAREALSLPPGETEGARRFSFLRLLGLG